jgi:hypothetical protein
VQQNCDLVGIYPLDVVRFRCAVDVGKPNKVWQTKARPQAVNFTFASRAYVDMLFQSRWGNS